MDTMKFKNVGETIKEKLSNNKIIFNIYLFRNNDFDIRNYLYQFACSFF